MNVLKYIAIALLIIGFLAILVYCIKSKKPFRMILFSALFGIIGLCIVDLTTKFTGVHIPINQWTLVGSTVFGIPAICGFLALNFIF